MTFNVVNDQGGKPSPTGLLVQFGPPGKIPGCSTIPTTLPSSIVPTASPIRVPYYSTGLFSLASDPRRDAFWIVTSLPDGSSFLSGQNAFLQSPNSEWYPKSSVSSGWIGISSDGNANAPVGHYQYQTTFSMQEYECKSLRVYFSVADVLMSVVVSDGVGGVTTFSTFDGNNGFTELSSFTATGLGAMTTMTFNVYNNPNKSNFLVDCLYDSVPLEPLQDAAHHHHLFRIVVQTQKARRLVIPIVNLE